MKRAIVILYLNNKAVGIVKITPKASSGLMWRELKETTWIDSPDIEIPFDESGLAEEIEE